MLSRYPGLVGPVSALGQLRIGLLQRIDYWLRAIAELSCRYGPAQYSPRVPPLALLDERVMDVPVRQLWRCEGLAGDFFASIETMLEAIARRLPAAADLVRRFSAFDGLPRTVTDPITRDRISSETEQLRRARINRGDQARSFAREEMAARRRHGTARDADPSVRALAQPPRAVGVSTSPWPAQVMDMGAIEACLFTPIAVGWRSLLSLFGQN